MTSTNRMYVWCFLLLQHSEKHLIPNQNLHNAMYIAIYMKLTLRTFLRQLRLCYFRCRGLGLILARELDPTCCLTWQKKECFDTQLHSFSLYVKICNMYVLFPLNIQNNFLLISGSFPFLVLNSFQFRVREVLFLVFHLLVP